MPWRAGPLRFGRPAALLVLLGLTFAPASAWAWGALAHELVASNVSALLPADAAPLVPLGPMLVRHVMDADRRAEDPGSDERLRHYFQLDAYGWPEREFIPADLRVAFARYGRERVRQRGLLPWAVVDRENDLVQAFRSRDPDRVAGIWADLCHYLADAAEPLNATLDSNGRRTGQPGVRARFDTGMLVRYRDHFHLPLAGLSVRMNTASKENAFADARQLLRESLSDAPRVLAADRGAARREGVGSAGYYARMWHEVGELAERRLAAATEASARLGYAAWLKAGRPDLASPPSEPGRP